MCYLGDNTKPSDQESTSRISHLVHYCRSGLVTQTNGCLEFSSSKCTEDRETLAVSLHAGLQCYSAKLNYILYVYAIQKHFLFFEIQDKKEKSEPAGFLGMGVDGKSTSTERSLSNSAGRHSCGLLTRKGSF